jgi:GT2 family glycosyltransferase
MTPATKSYYTLESLQNLTSRAALPWTISVVFYGNHPSLCRRFLEALYRCTDPKTFQLRAGMNAVCQETRELVRAASEKNGNILFIDSEKNLYKNPMMRRLFYETPLETEWTIWFDDDSYVTGPQWMLDLALAMERESSTDLFGHLMHVEVDAQLESFITTSKWYRGVARRQHEEHGRPIIRFPVGGFWAARTMRLQEINWPDPRLTLYHEDFIMGEAMRQNGIEPFPFDSGVRISDAPHRAPSDIPKELPFKAPHQDV